MAKLQKISKVALTFLNVGKIMVIFMLILGVAAPLFFLFVPEFESPTALLIGDLELTLSQQVPLQIPPLFCIIVLFIAVLDLLVGLRIIFHLQTILKPMAAGQPFHDQIAPAIRKIAWLHMISAFLTQVTSCTVASFTFRLLNVSELLVNEAISGAALDVQFDGSFIITFGILLLLSYVFEYGQQLQKLSDETV